MKGRLNDLGQVLAGVGDGLPTIAQLVNGKVVTSPPFGKGGAAMWEYRDGRSVLYLGHDPVTGAWSLLRYTPATGKTENLNAPNGNYLAVSEGRWACMTTAGLRANFPILPGSVMSLCRTDNRGAIGPNGLVALCSDQSCTAFDIYAPGAVTPVSHVAGVAYDLSVIDAARAVWTGGNFGVSVLPAQPMTGPIFLTVGGEDWLVGWMNNVGLVAQLNGAYEGYILRTDGKEFDYDAHVVNGQLVVAWSNSTAEAPGGTSIVVVDRTQPRVPLRPTVSVPAIGRPCAVGFYAFGNPSDAPGNVFHDVLSGHLIRRDNGEVIAQYAAAEADGTIAGLEAAVAAKLASDPTLPAMAYWPRGLQSGRAPIGAQLVSVELYQGLDESLAAFEARGRASVAKCAAAILVAQCYTSNATLTTDLNSLVPVYARIARDCPNVLGIDAFSAGAGRPTGWNDHPEVHAAWNALASSVTGLPRLPQPPTPKPPAPPTPKPKPPAPKPPTPPVPSTPFPAAHPLGGSMRAFVKIDSYYIGINQNATPIKLDVHGQPIKDGKGHTIPATGDDQWPVYYNRPGQKNEGGSWETVELTPHDGGTFDVLYVASNRQLSVQPDGSLQSRAAGKIGDYETFFATSQPDGSSLLYRFENGILIRVGVLTLEAA